LLLRRRRRRLPAHTHNALVPPNNNNNHSSDSIFSRLVPTVLGMGAVSSVLFGAKSLLFDESGN
jgi:hypothetical protein